MSLVVEINGQEFENIDEIETQTLLSDAVRTCRIAAFSTVPIDWPIKINDKVRILADGTPVMTGFIDAIDVEFDAGTHKTIAYGRSKTADIIDSTIESITFQPVISMEDIISQVISVVGANVSVSSEVDIDPFEKSEIKASEDGEGAFEIIERYARQRQVLVTDDAEGNFVITRNTQERSGESLRNVIGGGDQNNVKAARLRKDYQDRFKTYLFKSNDNPVSINFSGSGVDVKDVTDPSSGNVTDTDTGVRSSRKFVGLADNSSSSDILAQRATWEANIRRTRSNQIDTTMAGHSGQLGVWRPNTLVDVSIDFMDTADIMLIEGVRMTYSVKTGSLTQLMLTASDAFLVEASEPLEEERGSSLANIFGGDEA